jgi:hypothetical protein
MARSILVLFRLAACQRSFEGQSHALADSTTLYLGLLFVACLRVRRWQFECWAETSYCTAGVKVNRYPNTDDQGNDAKWVRGIESFEQCESVCPAESACSGYTYNFKQSACFQKSAMGHWPHLLSPQSLALRRVSGRYVVGLPFAPAPSRSPV